MIFCLAQGHASASGAPAQLIEDIRENRLGLADGRWALLESRSRLAMVQDLLLLLAPSRAVEAAPDPSSRVYLLCDQTTPEDAGFARQLQDRIRQQEKILVDLPQVASDGCSPAMQHERLLSACDGLLVYCEKAPARWYSRNVADLLTAERRQRTRELRSKALLVGDLPVTLPGLTVIHRSEPFDVGQLEPFLAPLRLPSSPGVTSGKGGG